MDLEIYTEEFHTGMAHVALEGSILEENCKGHKYVEWEVEYLSLPTFATVNSPSFAIGGQQYKLELRGNLKALDLNLCRMGPSASNEVLFSVGVKRGDGSHDHRLSSGQCNQSQNFKVWSLEACLASFERAGLEDYYSDSNGRVTFFMQMNTQYTQRMNVKCNHVVEKMTPFSDGVLREEDCSCRKHVEWDLQYASLTDQRIVSSPSFCVGTQRYLLDLFTENATLEMRLFRAGPSTEYPLRHCSGVKRSDGSYHHVMESLEMEQREDCEFWAMGDLLSTYHRADIERRHLSTDGHVTFFVRLSIGRKQTGTETCTHGIDEMIPSGDGLIREEECSGHKHVEWVVEYTSLPEEGDTFNSPVFSTGSQPYLLDLVCDADVFYLRLFYMGPSAGRRVQFLAGLKRGNGTYHHVIKSSYVQLKEVCEKWTSVSKEEIFARFGQEKWLFDADGKVTIFVRIDTDHTEEDTCTHGTDWLIPSGEGHIREEDCSDHKHVEWDVEYASLPQKFETMSSAAFSVGTQWYLLDLHPYDGSLGLRLFRFGPAVQDLGRCRAGIKSRDGSYYQNMTSGVFSQDKACKTWTFAVWLGNFDKYDVKNRHLAADDRMTFFFQIDVERAETGPKTCTHGAVRSIASGEGRIREEECIGHKHMEWDVKYDMLPEDQYTLRSPYFSFGSQRYYLQLKGVYSRFKDNHLELSIFRTGPALEKTKTLHCFAGVKRGDGSYSQLTTIIKMHQRKERLVWSSLSVYKFDRKALERQYRAPDGPVTLYVRISEERTQAGAEMCSFGAAEMTSSGEGCIRVEECNGHKHVEWEVKFGRLDDFQCSPTFQIGAQRFIMDMCNGNSCGEVRLFRAGPPVKLPMRCFLGMRNEDGSYSHEIWSMEVDLKEDSELFTLAWWHKHPSFFRIGLLTFFIRIIEERTKSVAEMCSYCSAKGISSGDGSIRQEECSGHTHLEWDVKDDPTNNDLRRSPVFHVGAQRFVLDWKVVCGGGQLRLFRAGPSAKLPLRCFLGMRNGDGSYSHEIWRIDVDQKNDSELWTLAWWQTHNSFYRERRLVLFLRIIEERTTSTAGTCSYCAAMDTPTGDGCMREVECSGHKHVEWDVEFDIFQHRSDYYLNFRSPVFEIGVQRFRLDVRCSNEDSITIRVFRVGPPAEGPLRCFVGMKFGDGSTDHRTKSELIDVDEEYEMWTSVNKCFFFEIHDVQSRRKHFNRLLTLLLRMDVVPTQDEAEACIYSVADLTPKSSGSVTEVELTCIKQVEWEFQYVPLSRIMTSPVFSVAGQNYLLEMNYATEMKLKLYRMGPSATESVRWWSNVKRVDGSSQCKSQCGRLDLEEKLHSMWKCVSVMHRLGQLHGSVHLIVTFLMSQEQQRTGEKVSTRARRLSDKNSDIVFRVKSREYEMSRVVLFFRVPLFKIMFSHDCMESRTNVVYIEDYKPDVIRDFLDFVYKGEPEIVTLENSFVLYSVAHKYFFEELKDECLTKVKEATVSRDNFFDAVTFLLACRDDDVLRKVMFFFSQNKDIVKTKLWHKFYRDNTRVANDLLRKAFLPDNDTVR